MTDALEKLQKLLKELFQIENAAGLDFGIYRVMNHRRDEISGFIDTKLPEIVEDVLKGGAQVRPAHPVLIVPAEVPASQERPLPLRKSRNFPEIFSLPLYDITVTR